MFATRIDTLDNIISYVGNNKIFSDNIQNYSANEYRRIDARLTLPPERSALDVMKRIEANLAKIPNVLTIPAPEIGILEVVREGTTVAVRPFVENKNYQQVLFDTNRMIVELLAENKEKNQQQL
jgi:small conductance mechanosensitive channel